MVGLVTGGGSGHEPFASGTKLALIKLLLEIIKHRLTYALITFN